MPDDWYSKRVRVFEERGYPQEPRQIILKRIVDDKKYILTSGVVLDVAVYYGSMADPYEWIHRSGGKLFEDEALIIFPEIEGLFYRK